MPPACRCRYRCLPLSRGRGDASDARHRGDDSRLLSWSTLHVNTTPRPRAPASPSAFTPGPRSRSRSGPMRHASQPARASRCGLGGLRFPMHPPHGARRPHGADVARQGEDGGSWAFCLLPLCSLLCSSGSRLGVSPARPAGAGCASARTWTIIGVWTGVVTLHAPLNYCCSSAIIAYTHLLTLHWPSLSVCLF